MRKCIRTRVASRIERWGFEWGWLVLKLGLKLACLRPDDANDADEDCQDAERIAPEEWLAEEDA